MTNPNYIKPGRMIVTHDGTFHADEVFAIALLITALGDIPVIRTKRENISPEMITHPECWIIDAAKIYDPAKRCFDHHQDENLHASNMLVLNYLSETKTISQDLYMELLNNFSTVSDIDRGGYERFNGWQVNRVIRQYNYVENGWDKALQFGRDMIQSAISTINEIAASQKIWEQGVGYLNDQIMSVDAFPIHWKRYASGHPVKLLLQKDEVANGDIWDVKYRLHTIDSRLYPIRAGYGEEYLHKARFYAIYKTFDQALEAAYATLKTIKA